MSHRSSNLRGVCIKYPVRTALSNALLLALTGNTFATDVANQSQYDAALLAGGRITVTSSFRINAMPGSPIGGDVLLSGALANFNDPVPVLDGGGGAHHAFSNWGTNYSLGLLKDLAIENFGAVAINNNNPGGHYSLLISNVRFANNSNMANQNDGGAVVSGRVYGIDNSAFINNSAGGNGGALMAPDMIGSIDNSTFINNSAGGDGGAVASSSISSISNSRFVDNVGQSGGAIYAHDGIYRIEDSTFINNRTHNSGQGQSQGGGALAVSSYYTDINNSAFLGNSAQGTGGRGGAINFFHGVNNSDSTLTLYADTNRETLFYGNRNGNRYNSIDLAGAGGNTSTVNVSGSGTVVMLDPMTAHSLLKTQFNVTGHWQLGGTNYIPYQSHWNINNGGTLTLTNVRYGAGNPLQNAAINLASGASSFTLGQAGRLGGSGTLKARPCPRQHQWPDES